MQRGPEGGGAARARARAVGSCRHVVEGTMVRVVIQWSRRPGSRELIEIDISLGCFFSPPRGTTHYRSSVSERRTIKPRPRPSGPDPDRTIPPPPPLCFVGRFAHPNTVFLPSPPPRFRGCRRSPLKPPGLPCAEMAPKSAIGKKKKSAYMQFCAEKRTEWKARPTTAALVPPCLARRRPPSSRAHSSYVLSLTVA